MAVTMLIRQLSRPEAADRLGHVLAMTPASEAGPAGDAPHVFDAETPAEEEVNVEAPAWQQLRDNAPFLTQENIAWQQLLSRAQGATGRTSQTPPETAYAQLVSQPDVYRGRLVRVEGAVLRESLKQAPENDLGVSQYHQLVLAPAGGGEWPIVVYALALPEGFPRGEARTSPVTIDGWFFKVWSFSDGERLGLAPVIVAQSIGWLPPSAPAAQPERAPVARPLVWALVVAAAAGAAMAAWAARQTRRRASPARAADSDAARDALEQLARQEGAS